MESLSSTYIPSNLAGPERNLTQTDDRCFGRIIRGRADTPFLTLSLEAYKESRLKRLVIKHEKHNFETVMLQYLIDMAASTTRLYSPNKLILILYEGLKPVKPFFSTCRYILFLTLSRAEVYKKSRQKRLAAKHRKLSLIHI